MEDGPPIYPFNITDFSVTDDDNIYLLRATVTIQNANDILPRFEDELFAESNSRFNVSQNGITQIIIEAIGPLRLYRHQDEFVDFLRTVGFTTNDQSPYVVRNLTLVVEEHPLGETQSAPAEVPILVQPVNDIPVLLSNQISDFILNDYLPQETNNPGFDSSYLLSESDVMDIDRLSPISADFIGLALVSVDVLPYLGVWQYWNTTTGDWVDFPAMLSDCSPLLVDPETRVRFMPVPNYDKLDGETTVEYRAWDGTSSEVTCVNSVLEFSEGERVCV